MNEKKYDLEERTEKFSLNVRNLCKLLVHDIINIEYVKQLTRSAGSVAANYIEANEHLGERDLKMRIRICKKETKESRLWLKHLTISSEEQDRERNNLVKESFELQYIFAAILKKLNSPINS